jgi:hypothetical protein
MKTTTKEKLVFIGLILFIAGCSGGGPGGKNTTGYTVSGQVTSADGTAGVSGVTISITGSYSGTTTTDANGKWNVTGLNGTVTVTPSKIGCSFDSSSQTVSGTSTVNFKVIGFNDDFSNPASGWAISSDSDYSFSYITKKYEMKIANINTLYISQAPVNTSNNFTVEVTMSLASGSANAKYGIMFNDGENFFYGFRITEGTTPEYQIFKLYGENDNYSYPVDWTKDSHIQTNVNTLKVQQNGTKAYFYINGSLVNSITVDPHSTNSLGIGLLVGSYDTVPVIVDFSNFKLSSDKTVSATASKQMNMMLNNIPIKRIRSYSDR